MEFVNLTPHVLNVHRKDGTIKDIVPSGQVARCSAFTEEIREVDGIAFYFTTYGEVTGLPEPAEDTIFVVSGMVRKAVGVHRPDVVSPGQLLRNEEGKPVGCDGLNAV